MSGPLPPEPLSAEPATCDDPDRPGPNPRRQKLQEWIALARTVPGRFLIAALVACGTCLPAAVVTVSVVLGWAPMISWDEGIVRSATEVTRGNRPMILLLLLWKDISAPTNVYLLSAPALVWAWRSDYRHRTLWAGATMYVGSQIGPTVKEMVARPRPDFSGISHWAPGFSFPSGHVFHATLMFCTVLVLVWPLLTGRPPWIRICLVCVAVLFCAVTALNRLYLGVHFPSDVLAGLLLAGGLTLAAWVGLRHRPARQSAS
ncbi:phosphatase PAP2 family protein [Austwickia chelonae]|uniref:phosphatase PAP2 family protein n=1 Tax=Austwickia chelonae TaxID=100225 RepID=UPI000E28689E|nr:phosphatase PAP2 family protein [Austwickia chelonae]